MLMYGSTIVADLITERAIPHPALWSLTGTYEDTFCLAGGLSASRRADHLAARPRSAGCEYAVLTEEAEEVPPGSNGLLALPYFAGERTPISDPHARGVIAGLTLGTTRGELYRALLEATAYGTRHLLQSMAEAGAAGKRCVAVGGGTKGGVWTQIISDVCGIEQDLPKLRHRRQLRRRAAGRAGRPAWPTSRRTGRRSRTRCGRTRRTSRSTTTCSRTTWICTRRRRTSSTTCPGCTTGRARAPVVAGKQLSRNEVAEGGCPDAHGPRAYGPGPLLSLVLGRVDTLATCPAPSAGCVPGWACGWSPPSRPPSRWPSCCCSPAPRSSCSPTGCCAAR